MNFQYLKDMTERERGSDVYLFYLSENNNEHIKIGAYKKLGDGLKSFLKRKTAEDFELYIWRNNPKNTKTYTEKNDIQSDLGHYKLILTVDFNGKQKKAWEGRVNKLNNGRSITKEEILNNTIKKLLHTTAYEIIKSVDRGFVFNYRDSYYKNKFLKGQLIFESEK